MAVSMMLLLFAVLFVRFGGEKGSITLAPGESVTIHANAAGGADVAPSGNRSAAAKWIVGKGGHFYYGPADALIDVRSLGEIPVAPFNIRSADFSGVNGLLARDLKSLGQLSIQA